jgi:hypothetical protein
VTAAAAREKAALELADVLARVLTCRHRADVIIFVRTVRVCAECGCVSAWKGPSLNRWGPWESPRWLATLGTLKAWAERARADARKRARAKAA